MVGKEFLQSIAAAPLNEREIAARIQTDRINTVFLDPFARWNKAYAPLVMDTIHAAFPKVRFILFYTDPRDRDEAEHEIRLSYPNLSGLRWLNRDSSDQAKWRENLRHVLESAHGDMLVKRGVTTFALQPTLLSVAKASDTAWRFAVMALVLAFGLLGFLMLSNNFLAVLWLVFFVLALPLAVASVSSRRLGAKDFVTMYKAGLNALPIIGRLLRHK